MKRNDLVLLGNLRTGDRFVFVKKPNEVWQTTGAKLGKPWVAYNKIYYTTGSKAYVHDLQKSAYTQVRFMRHTQPAPGEETLLNDLQVGDIFFMPGDVISEYQVLQTRTAYKDVVIQQVQGAHDAFEHCDVAVTFIRKEEEVKA